MAEATVLTEISESFVVMEVNGFVTNRKASVYAKKAYSQMSEHSSSELVARTIGTSDFEDKSMVVVGPIPDREYL